MCQDRTPRVCTGSLVDVGVRTGSLGAVIVGTGHLVYVGKPYRIPLVYMSSHRFPRGFRSETDSLVDVRVRSGSLETLSVRTAHLVYAVDFTGHFVTVGVRTVSSRL